MPVARLPALTSWPMLLILVVCFEVPLAALLVRSVWNEHGIGLGAFVELAERRIYLKILVSTLRISVAATIVVVVIGYPLALWIRMLADPYKAYALALVAVSAWVSILVRTYAWIVILGTNGVVNRALATLGWIDAPLPLLYNEFGVILGMANVLAPFFILPVYAAMARIDDRLFLAAATLGASTVTTLVRVLLPLTVPAVTAGILLVFSLSLGFYITPAILGGGRVPMLGNVLDIMINETARWDLAAALSVLLLITTAAAFGAVRAAERRFLA